MSWKDTIRKSHSLQVMRGGALLSVVSLLGVGMALGNQFKAEPTRMTNGTAWVDQGDDLIRGSSFTGRADALLSGAAAGDSKIAQDGDDTVVVVGDRAFAIDGRSLKASSGDKVAEETTPYVRGGKGYLVSQGQVRCIDPVLGDTLGEPIDTAGNKGVGVVDDDGVLWLAFKRDGFLWKIRDCEVERQEEVFPAGHDVELTLAGGRPVLYDRTDGMVGRIDRRTAKITSRVAVPKGGRVQGPSQEGDRVWVSTPGTEVVGVDGSDEVSKVDVGVDSLLQPQVVKDRVLVPSSADGGVVVVVSALPGKTPKREATKPLPAAAEGDFESFVKDGQAWFNAPDAKKAGTIATDGEIEALKVNEEKLREEETGKPPPPEDVKAIEPPPPPPEPPEPAPDAAPVPSPEPAPVTVPDATVPSAPQVTIPVTVPQPVSSAPAVTTPAAPQPTAVQPTPAPQTQPQQTQPLQTQPLQTQPQQTAPRETAPRQQPQPEQSQPAQTPPEQTPPEQIAPQKQSVPNVVGQPRASACQAIASAGLRCVPTPLDGLGSPANQITAQNPGSGTQLDAGASVQVDYYADAGVTVPDVSTEHVLTQAAACQALTDANLVCAPRLGTYTTPYERGTPPGEIIGVAPGYTYGQNVQAGQLVATGTTVTVDVEQQSTWDVTLSQCYDPLDPNAPVTVIRGGESCPAGLVNMGEWAKCSSQSGAGREPIYSLPPKQGAVRADGEPLTGTLVLAEMSAIDNLNASGLPEWEWGGGQPVRLCYAYFTIENLPPTGQPIRSSILQWASSADPFRYTRSPTDGLTILYHF